MSTQGIRSYLFFSLVVGLLALGQVRGEQADPVLKAGDGKKTNAEPAASKDQEEHGVPAATVKAKAPVTDDTIQSMAGRTWTLASMKANGHEYKLTRTKPYFKVTPEGEVNGVGVPNAFWCRVTVVGGKLKWGLQRQTAIGGGPALEEEFHKNLGQTTSAQASEGKLVLSNNDDTIVLTFTSK